MIGSFQDLLSAFGALLIRLIPLSVAVALLFFLWGLTLFILNSGDEKKVVEGKSKIVWGLVVLFIMVSIWALVGLLQKDLIGGSTNGGTVPVIRNGTIPPDQGGGGTSGGTSGSGGYFTPPCGEANDLNPFIQPCL